MTLAVVIDRVRRLADTLTDLKTRIRIAVATEVGRAVADAVRDLLTAALAGRVEVPGWAPRTGPFPATASRGWDDDGWSDDPDDPDGAAAWAPRRVVVDQPTSRPGAAAKGKSALMSALPVVLSVVRWWAVRAIPSWAAVGVGIAASLTAVLGGPLARVALAILITVAELVPVVEPSSWLEPVD